MDARVSHGLLDALDRVEAVPATASGALVIGAAEHPAGLVLVERNRVCWAAASGMGRRLRDILRMHTRLPMSDVELDELYARCRDEDRPLGEVLVERELVSPEHMRAAMKQHTIESLLALDAAYAGGDEGWPLTWVDRAERTYNPRYTFTAAEVLGAVGASLIDATSAELITDHLETLAVSGCAIAAFAPDDGHHGPPLVVGAQTTLRLSVHDLVDLAEWANAALEASPGFSPELAHACAGSADGGTVAWQFERQTCAAVCPSRPAFKRLVATLDNRSLAMVLATKLSVLERVRERMALTQG